MSKTWTNDFIQVTKYLRENAMVLEPITLNLNTYNLNLIADRAAECGTDLETYIDHIISSHLLYLKGKGYYPYGKD